MENLKVGDYYFLNNSTSPQISPFFVDNSSEPLILVGVLHWQLLTGETLYDFYKDKFNKILKKINMKYFQKGWTYFSTSNSLVENSVWTIHLVSLLSTATKPSFHLCNNIIRVKCFFQNNETSVEILFILYYNTWRYIFGSLFRVTFQKQFFA